MQDLVSRRFGRALLVVALLAMGLNILASTFSTSPASVALASVAAGDDEDEDEDNDQGESEADRELEGTVEAIDKSKNPPEAIVRNIDGPVVVKMLKTDEFDIQGIKVGDYVSFEGEKIHELLFEASTVEKK